jgi:solute carrier family 25 S-adenosylmethionine transporter 26
MFFFRLECRWNKRILYVSLESTMAYRDLWWGRSLTGTLRYVAYRMLSSPIPTTLHLYYHCILCVDNNPCHSHYCLLFAPQRVLTIYLTTTYQRVLTFGSYEMYKKTMLKKFPNVKPIFVYAVAAVMGDLTGSGWLCPSEVVKQKMQAGMFKTTGEAVSSIWKQKGLVGLYEGYFGGIARDVPFRVAQLTTYELTKNLYMRVKTRRHIAAEQQKQESNRRGKRTKDEQPDLQLSAIEAAVCGAVAGSFSAAITAPLDRFKTLLMTDSAAYGGTVASCAAQLWKKEGIRGFTTGVVPRVVYIAPSVVIFFIAYEQVQQRLQHWQ